MSDSITYDCVIIGGGPAGLTAALYLRRFRRNIVLIDAGASRARWIPQSHNCAGFPGGVSGTAFLSKLHQQIAQHDVQVVTGLIEQAHRQAERFSVSDGQREWHARTLLLATGVVDVLPTESWVAEAIECGALRLCPICDGYEASDRKLATIGPLNKALEHAIFLRTYSQTVAAADVDATELNESTRQRANDNGIELLTGRNRLEYDGSNCLIVDANQQRHRFDAVYPVLGCDAQSELATALGANVDENGELLVDTSQMTSIEGLYAIGDIVSAINQIAVALGHAAVAATAIHNALPQNRA